MSKRSRSVFERFWSKVLLPQPGSTCLEWAKPKQVGYGYFLLDGKERPAHRVAYEWTYGPIPDGLVIDHLCRNKRCVNPDHLEAVTHLANVQRGTASAVWRQMHADRTHCKHGHEFTPENTTTRRHSDGHEYRSCRACDRDRVRVRRNRYNKETVNAK
jgi:hypothetical protein